MYMYKHINNYKFHHCNLSMNLPRCRNHERGQRKIQAEHLGQGICGSLDAFGEPWNFHLDGWPKAWYHVGSPAKSLINSLKPGNFPAILAFRTSSKWVMTCYDHTYSIHIEILLKYIVVPFIKCYPLVI